MRRDRSRPVREALVASVVDRHRGVRLEDEHVARRSIPKSIPRNETSSAAIPFSAASRAAEMRGHVVKYTLFGAVVSSSRMSAEK